MHDLAGGRTHGYGRAASGSTWGRGRLRRIVGPRGLLDIGLPVECRPGIPWKRNLVRTLDRMLSPREVDGLCDRLGLSAEARTIIETVRSEPPARRVRSAAG